MNKTPMKHTKNKKQLTWLGILAFAGVLTVAIWFESKPRVNTEPPIVEELPHYLTYEVVNIYPHDPEAFTQGLVYHQGYLYESTGLYGRSSLRKVELETGIVLKQVDLPEQYFAEGLALWGSTLLQLTWRENTGFIFDLNDFHRAGTFEYATEGWGLTQNGDCLIMSDGTDRLLFFDPKTYDIIGQIEVTDRGEPVMRLNELEFVRGEVYANVWLTDQIVRIDHTTGAVKGWIDLEGILPDEYRQVETDVLNGIAYDPEGERLFVTGKNWPLLFEIHLVEAEPDA